MIIPLLKFFTLQCYCELKTKILFEKSTKEKENVNVKFLLVDQNLMRPSLHLF